MIDPAAFIRASTTIASPPLVPEISLHIARDMTLLVHQLQLAYRAEGLALPHYLQTVPYWAAAWPGGQVLARYLLDNPDTVRGKRVMDLGAGCGIGAIAALKAGAGHVSTTDIDPLATNVVYLNAALNDVAPAVLMWDFLDIALPFPRSPQHPDVILVGELFDEKSRAERIAPWLVRAAADNIVVLIGASERRFLPEAGLEQLATYQVPVSFDIDRRRNRRVMVYRLHG